MAQVMLCGDFRTHKEQLNPVQDRRVRGSAFIAGRSDATKEGCDKGCDAVDQEDNDADGREACDKVRDRACNHPTLTACEA